ncbi:MAG: PH domain-containing protein [Pseudomonadota bacterium]
MADRQWQRVSPLSLVFFVADMVRVIARNFIQVGVPTFAFLVSTGGFSRERLTMIGAAIVLVTLTYAIAMYLNTRFRFGDERIMLRTGVFSRKQLDVEYARIQALNLSANPIYRWLGVNTVSIDSAGSTDSEIVLPAVGDDIVATLRAKIDRQEPVAPVSAIEPDDESAPLIQLGATDMVKIGISSQRSLVFLAVLGSAFGAVESQRWAERWLDDWLSTWIGDTDHWSLVEWVGIATGGLFLAVLLFVIAMIASAFVRYYGFKLIDRTTELVSGAGLITYRTQTLPLSKAQRLDVQRGLVHQWLKRAELGVQQAAGATNDDKGEFVVPLLTDTGLSDVAERVLDGNRCRFLQRPAGAAFQRIHRYYWLANWRRSGLLPAILCAGFFYQIDIDGWLWALPILWPLISALYYGQRLRRWGYFLFDDGLAIRHGLLGETIEVFLWRKTQFITVRETPLLARKGLAHLTVATAAGRRRLPFIPREVATAFANTALLRAESSPTPWI